MLRHFQENLKCYLVCLALSAAPMEYGLDNSVLNGLQATPSFLKIFGHLAKSGSFVLDTQFQQLFVSLPNVGLIIGSLLVGPLSQIWGRRVCLILASVVCYIGIIIQLAVVTRQGLYAGRFILGVANGLYVAIFPLYASEVTLPRYRALNVSLIQISLTFGTLLGSIISNAFHSGIGISSYQKQLSTLFVLPSWIVLIVFFLPESPRWLVTHDRLDQAHSQLRRLRGNSWPEAKLSIELTEIKTAVDTERELTTNTPYIAIWRGTDLRRTLLCAACDTLQAASGLNFFLAYVTFFFQIAGVEKPFTATIVISSISLLGVLTTTFTMTRVGRRPLLLGAFSMTTLTLFAIAIIYTASRHTPGVGKALVALVAIYHFSWSAMGGATAFVSGGEIPSNSLRSITFGFGRGVGLFFSWLTVFTTPYFINPTALNWGAKVAWIWASSCFVSLIFIYFYLPETQGRSLEEIDELFFRKVPAWRFKTFDLDAVAVESAASPGNGTSLSDEKEAAS